MEFVMSGEAQKKIKIKLQKAFAMRVCVWVCIQEMLCVLMNAVKNIYSICVMACDAIKFIPTRTSRVMASQRGQQEKESGREGGKEMPARSSG